ncbi:hypothetical protein HPB49_024671 [Dermacentor silvarum]|uniref:Uncharacterized protein n=1 Tax=Dermacentor silvarum TaxID=543639 RepID=A0ACB8E4N6_DERSI|nr:hypothetical protein HPB49_024671 [Dermacentor silvarum]
MADCYGSLSDFGDFAGRVHDITEDEAYRYAPPLRPRLRDRQNAMEVSSDAEFSWRYTAVIEQLEGQWLCMVRRNMSDHVREFFAVMGFPHAGGALDECHFPVSPPKEHATDYYKHKGW